MPAGLAHKNDSTGFGRTALPSSASIDCIDKFSLLLRQRHNSISVDTLLDGIKIDALIAEKAVDTNAICKKIDEKGPMDVILSKIKKFRRIATQYDKTDTSCEAMINIEATAIALRSLSNRLSIN